jgi:hypothetical protein
MDPIRVELGDAHLRTTLPMNKTESLDEHEHDQ